MLIQVQGEACGQHCHKDGKNKSLPSKKYYQASGKNSNFVLNILSYAKYHNHSKNESQNPLHIASGTNLCFRVAIKGLKAEMTPQPMHYLQIRNGSFRKQRSEMEKGKVNQHWKASISPCVWHSSIQQSCWMHWKASSALSSQIISNFNPQS